MPAPSVIFSPDAHQSIQRGFGTLADLLARTIGPAPRQILSAGSPHTDPELLSDAATIARRFLALPDRREDVGAMLARNLVWRVHQTTGDGGATAVALAHAISLRSRRYAAEGADTAGLRAGIAAGIEAALSALQQMTRPVCDERDLLHVAQTATGEQHLSTLIAEIYDILGPDGFVSVEEYLAPYLERDYIQGGQWLAHLASPYLVSNTEQHCATLQDAAVALYAGEISDLDEIRPLLETLVSTDRRRLLLVANRISGTALNTLVLNHQRKQIQLVGATCYRVGQENHHDFEDLAILTGARLFDPAIGDRLRTITPADLGTVRYVRATRDRLIVSEHSERPALREHIAALRQHLAQVLVDSDDERIEIRQRIGRLSGRVAILKVGAATRFEATTLLQKAEQGVRAVGSAMHNGVAPGGGVAYLDCIPAVRGLHLSGDARYGAEIVAQALEAPFRWIVTNAGTHAPAAILDELRRHGAGYGYDANAAAIVKLDSAGLLDSAAVLTTALRTAASAATMLLTTDVVVLKRHPELSMEP